MSDVIGDLLLAGSRFLRWTAETGVLVYLIALVMLAVLVLGAREWRRVEDDRRRRAALRRERPEDV